MFTASRHAQRLAGNFLDDVDEFQRASRDADRRAMSHFESAVDPLVALETAPLPPAPFILRAPSPSRRIRYGSVPPVSPAATVQYYGSTPRYGVRPFTRAGSVSRISMPSRVYTSYVADLTGSEPITTKRLLGSQNGLPPPTPIRISSTKSLNTIPLTQNASVYIVYHSPITLSGLPPIAPHYKPYFRRYFNGVVHPAAHRPEDHEVMLERRRIDRKLDGLLSYKLPDTSIFNEMRSSLRSVRAKMNDHRTLLDRYSAIDMQDSGVTTEDRIAAKYREMRK